MLQHFTDGDDARPFADLRGGEREILDLIAAGLRNHAIAERLHLAPKTVANHISSILTKLRVTDRLALIVQAGEQGSVDVDEATVAFVIAALTSPLGAAILIGLARPRIIDVRALLAGSVVAVVVTTACTAAFVGLWAVLDCLAREIRRRRRGTRGRCSAALRFCAEFR